LGDSTVAPEIEVRWPNGKTQKLQNVNAGQTLILREPALH
jgi:hypothetical protein